MATLQAIRQLMDEREARTHQQAEKTRQSLTTSLAQLEQRINDRINRPNPNADIAGEPNQDELRRAESSSGINPRDKCTKEVVGQGNIRA